jgi:DNA-3-methyladenine glycosylase I
MSYCSFCNEREEHDVHRDYHESQYGFPIEDDNELFGRLILEINQAGLSWGTILNKQQNFRKAFDNYSIAKIANYDEIKIQELLTNAGIIRNKLKVRSVVYNAQQIQYFKEDLGSFKNWLDSNHPKSKEEWTILFKKTFKFVGGEIVNEFLMSTGYLKGAHDENCIIFDVVKKTNPKWLEL